MKVELLTKKNHKICSYMKHHPENSNILKYNKKSVIDHDTSRNVGRGVLILFGWALCFKKFKRYNHDKLIA